jgi:hypothetical protein
VDVGTGEEYQGEQQVVRVANAANDLLTVDLERREE